MRRWREGGKERKNKRQSSVRDRKMMKRKWRRKKDH